VIDQKILENVANREWRFNHLYRIRNKQRETVPLRLNAVQQAVRDDNHRFPQILKPRQVGISTLFLIEKLDAAMFHENYTCCVVAHEQDSIRKLFRIVRFAYDNIPDPLKPVLDKGGGSMYELRFPKLNSKIYVDLESRSETIDDLHISEIAFMKNMDKVNATIDSVPVTTGRISVESTANGLNDFYDRWQSPFFISSYLSQSHPSSLSLLRDQVEFLLGVQSVAGLPQVPQVSVVIRDRGGRVPAIHHSVLLVVQK